MFRTIAVDNLAVCAMLLLVSTAQTMGNSLDSKRVALLMSFGCGSVRIDGSDRLVLSSSEHVVHRLQEG